MKKPTDTHQQYKPYIEIVSGSLWAKRHLWRGMARRFSPNVCLLVPDTTNKPLTQLMGKIARSFRASGRQVFIWRPPQKKGTTNIDA